MQSVNLFDSQTNMDIDLQAPSSSPRISGFWDAPAALPASSIAAAVALAVSRGLVARPERERLPMR